MTKKVREYSSGNRRKLGLILALMHNPELLILDEPTGGLDPLMQQIFHEMMHEVRKEGRTVFLSSHVLSEVQAICDRVGILRDGDLKAVEDVAKLTHVEFRRVEMTFRDAVPQTWLPRLQAIDSLSDVESDDNMLKVRLTGDFDPLMRAVSDGYVQNIRILEPTLEEIFLAYYGNNTDVRQQKETV
jgi:ABC-2 type transport system ATP-binding protein